MSLLSKLFGGGSKPKPEAQAVEYKGYAIKPQPISTDGGYRISAVIEREVDGEMRSHTLIRADIIRDPEEAEQASVGKARQMIDQMGVGLFNA